MLLLLSTANLPICRLAIILRLIITWSCARRNHVRLLPYRRLVVLLGLERFSVGHGGRATAVQIGGSRQPRHR